MNDDINDIRWETPPPKRSGRRKSPGRTERFVNVLRQRPGQWAVYDDSMSRTTASTYRTKYPQVEWTQRNNPDGETCTVYARWIGQP